MNIFDLSKLNKYQKGMIIASLIFLISMIGFLFNSRVRLSESYIEEPEIIIDDPEQTEENKGNNEYIFMLVIMTMPLVLWKLIGDVMDV